MRQKLIVGLGNPGKQYEYTRHNLGFLVVQQIAESLKIKFKASSLTNGLVAEGSFDDVPTVLFMPATFMNHSGLAVKKMVDRKEVALEDMLVVCDDLNLDFGQLRLRPEGSGGGHNGLLSVIEHVQSNRFPRLRMGIGRPDRKEDVIAYVLENFTKTERGQLNQFVAKAAQCCMAWLTAGAAKAMDQFNKRENV